MDRLAVDSQSFGRYCGIGRQVDGRQVSGRQILHNEEKTGWRKAVGRYQGIISLVDGRQFGSRQIQSIRLTVGRYTGRQILCTELPACKLVT